MSLEFVSILIWIFPYSCTNDPIKGDTKKTELLTELVHESQLGLEQFQETFGVMPDFFLISLLDIRDSFIFDFRSHRFGTILSTSGTKISRLKINRDFQAIQSMQCCICRSDRPYRIIQKKIDTSILIYSYTVIDTMLVCMVKIQGLITTLVE